MKDHEFNLNDILDNLGYISYITDIDGIAVAYTKKSWCEFAEKNGAKELINDQAVIGKSIFSFIGDKDTQDSYLQFHQVLKEGRAQHIKFCFRCDGPDIQRWMHMSINPIKKNEKVRGFFYSSLVLEEKKRVSLKFLERRENKEDLPLVTVCSYCCNVQLADEWVAPDLYYREGGAKEVDLSHGVCPVCYQDIIKPYLVEMKSKDL